MDFEGVIRYDGYIYVPGVGELILSIMHEDIALDTLFTLGQLICVWI